MPKTNTFFTSDTHYFHDNCIEFDQRPFSDIEHMHRVLINNYNNTVRPEDTCFFLGDVGFCSTEKLKPVIDQLNGNKVLILGNHDKGPNAMKSLGFHTVLYSASLFIAGKVVTISHCPLRGVFREDVTNMKGSQPGECWHGESRHQKFSLPDFGQVHLHGHLHKKPKERILDRQFDVGVVANGYRPVAQSVIESWVAKTPKS